MFSYINLTQWVPVLVEQIWWQFIVAFLFLLGLFIDLTINLGNNLSNFHEGFFASFVINFEFAQFLIPLIRQNALALRLAPPSKQSTGRIQATLFALLAIWGQFALSKGA